MSDRSYSGIFWCCCCRRSEAKSPTKHAANILSKQSLKEIEECDDVSISVTVPPTEASKSRELTHLWSSGSFTSEEKSFDVQQRAEAENGSNAGQSQNRDSATLVLSSRLNSGLLAEGEAEAEVEPAGAQQVMVEGPQVDVLQSSLDSLRPAGDGFASAGDQPSLEYLVAFEKVIVQLETLADQLEKDNGVVCPVSDVVPVSDPDRPSIYLNNGQWIVANHSGSKDLVVKMTDDHQSVNICDCSGCTIRVEGKAETIAINNCVKCDMVLQETSKPVTLTDCRRLQLQVLGMVPSIDARNTDGLSLYLGQQSQNVSMFGFKCSELNILVPLDDGDFKEIPLPEQFQSRWVVDRWVTSVMDVMD